MIENSDLIKLPELPVIELVDDPVQVYKEFMVIRAALQIGLFDWMNKAGRSTIEEISAGTGIAKEYISAFMAMLFYLDIVRRSDDVYYLSPSASLHFVTSSNYYQGDIIVSLGSESSPWYDLHTFLTNPDEKNIFNQKDTLVTAADAEREMRGMIKNVTTVISRWAGFKEAKSFLEIGRGHGLYAIALCQIHPSIKATVVSTPESEKLLSENIKKYGMEERIKEVQKIPSPNEGTYDIVLASNSLYDPDRNGKTISECLSEMESAINENGLFVSNHWFNHPPQGTGMQGLYELELALHNRYHTIQSQEEFEESCAANHLSIFQTGVMRSMYGESIIHMATKKQNSKGEAL